MEEKKRTQDGKNGGRSDELERSLTEARSELMEHECLELREANRQLSAQADWHTQQLAELQSSLSWRLIHRFHDLGARVAPSGSKRRQILMRTAGIGMTAEG